MAEGRTDGRILLTNKPWDMAAGVIIARESGAIVTDSDAVQHGVQSAYTVATSPGISGQLLEQVASALATAEGS